MSGLHSVWFAPGFPNCFPHTHCWLTTAFWKMPCELFCVCYHDWHQSATLLNATNAATAQRRQCDEFLNLLLNVFGRFEFRWNFYARPSKLHTTHSKFSCICLNFFSASDFSSRRGVGGGWGPIWRFKFYKFAILFDRCTHIGKLSFERVKWTLVFFCFSHFPPVWPVFDLFDFPAVSLSFARCL